MCLVVAAKMSRLLIQLDPIIYTNNPFEVPKIEWKIVNVKCYTFSKFDHESPPIGPKHSSPAEAATTLSHPQYNVMQPGTKEWAILTRNLIMSLSFVLSFTFTPFTANPLLRQPIS